MLTTLAVASYGSRMRRGSAVSAIVLFVWLCCGSCTPIRGPAQETKSEQRDAAASPAVNDAIRVQPAATPDECKADEDCGAPSPCSTATCEQGRCVVGQLPEGAAVALGAQVAADCRRLVCDAKGRLHSENDDADKPDGDGNPCHDVTCEGGALRTTNMADGAPCNDNGMCKAGECSQCVEGAECPRAGDCTVFRWTCKSGAGVCEDTGVARDGIACEAGKVCSAGSCVPCELGSECEVDLPCHSGRRASCAGAMECEAVPLSGMACGNDPMGRELICSAGECVLPSGALVNGDFRDGFTGWTLTGAAKDFLITNDPNRAHWRVVSSSASDRGTVSQSFVVPDDALALRFVVSGGASHVRLKDEGGATLEECNGPSSKDAWLPVSWELVSRRGQRLTIAIEDDEVDDDWAFIRASGFDVIREVEAPLRNSQFARKLADWETSGDGQYFNVYNDYSANLDEQWGRIVRVSTYAREGAVARQGVQSRGVVSQSFSVPPDARALRFSISGGSGARVRLYEGDNRLASVSALDSENYKVAVSWDLESHRGKVLRIAIEDDDDSVPYGFINASAFDVITSYNGP